MWFYRVAELGAPDRSYSMRVVDLPSLELGRQAVRLQADWNGLLVKLLLTPIPSFLRSQLALYQPCRHLVANWRYEIVSICECRRHSTVRSLDLRRAY